jgi:WS/DGAT/MGAT family acyltransferase
MEKLNFQDASFLRLESAQRPFHVGGLLIFAAPPDARPGFLRRLAVEMGEKLPEMSPLFLRKLYDPELSGTVHWVRAEDYEARYHVLHYGLPKPGRMEDLLNVVSLAHERPLDRSRPLWEWHLIEGLPGNRFALYCKMHHALIDGVGALRLMDALLTTDARKTAIYRRKKPQTDEPHAGHSRRGLFGEFSHMAELMMEQGRAVSELVQMFLRMESNSSAESHGIPPLPFSAPHAIMNTEIGPRRRIVMAEFPLQALRRIGKAVDGTVNDALLAVCGGALRSYLAEHRQLPSASLLAGSPVSIKAPGEQHGNQLSTIVSSFGTTTRDPVKRLKTIARMTRQAKEELQAMSQAARQDYMNLILLPTIVLTLAHASTAIPPAFNVIVSNVPGPQKALYLAGARLEAIYPLSVVTDAQAMNITAISYESTICVGITTCPDNLPEIDSMAKHLREAYRELKQSLKLR